MPRNSHTVLNFVSHLCTFSTILVRFVQNGKPHSAANFQSADTVANLLDFVGMDCFLDALRLNVSVASGQGKMALWKVFGSNVSQVTLNIVTLEDCQIDSNGATGGFFGHIPLRKYHPLLLPT